MASGQQIDFETKKILVQVLLVCDVDPDQGIRSQNKWR